MYPDADQYGSVQGSTLREEGTRQTLGGSERSKQDGMTHRDPNSLITESLRSLDRSLQTGVYFYDVSDNEELGGVEGRWRKKKLIMAIDIEA